MLSRRESFVYMHIIELRLVKMRFIITITNATNEKRIQSCIALIVVAIVVIRKLLIIHYASLCMEVWFLFINIWTNL